eukprot:12845037-Prorocentrum_lima.AAC.1
MWLLLDENTPDPMDDASFRVALLDRLLRDRPAASRNALGSDTCCNRTEAGNRCSQPLAGTGHAGHCAVGGGTCHRHERLKAWLAEALRFWLRTTVDTKERPLLKRDHTAGRSDVFLPFRAPPLHIDLT